VSDFRGVNRGQLDCLGKLVLYLDGQLGQFCFRHHRIQRGLGQGFLEILQLDRGQQGVGHFRALLITIICLFGVSLDSDDFIGIWHLQDQIGIMRDCHKLGQARPSEESVVCHFEIGYFELQVLSVIILPGS
jgi:hypothetical protein